MSLKNENDLSERDKVRFAAMEDFIKTSLTALDEMNDIDLTYKTVMTLVFNVVNSLSRHSGREELAIVNCMFKDLKGAVRAVKRTARARLH